MRDYYKNIRMCHGIYHIDTAYGIGDLPAAVRSVTDLPLIILNAHSHGDHIGANGLFSEPIYM